MRHFLRLNGFAHIGGSKMKPVGKQMVCLERSQHVMDLFGQLMKHVLHVEWKENVTEKLEILFGGTLFGMWTVDS